jgi:signal transduction histidine kinase
MFNKVRLQLTLTYLLISLIILVIIGSVAYELLAYYFESRTDLALRHKMAHEYESRELPMPTELAIADIYWDTMRDNILALPFYRTKLPATEELTHTIEVYEALEKTIPHNFVLEEIYDGELAAIFHLPLDEQGQLLPMAGELPIDQQKLPDQQAVQFAKQNNFDLRTIVLATGARVRLLTYRFPANSDMAYMQLGRLLTDQTRLLQQLAVVLIVISFLLAFLASLGGWWAAGRSLRPTQQALRQQRRFVASASHELRTPLTLIRASAEVARSHPALTGEDKGLMNDIIGEVDHMTRLVEDLLLLSRLDVRRLTLASQPVVLAELLKDVQRATAHLASERDLTVAISTVEGIVLGDYGRLRQILLILLDNALHYTPAGGSVTLRTKQDGHSVRLVVTDSGIGIAREHLPQLFERFYQVDSSRHERGAGLGLSIAKMLVEAQKGEIELESELGRGTTVSIILPSYPGQ